MITSSLTGRTTDAVSLDPGTTAWPIVREELDDDAAHDDEYADELANGGMPRAQNAVMTPNKSA